MTWRYDLADLAHYQDEAGALIDWDALAAGSPGSGAATKISQGNAYLDPTRDRHRSEMVRTGMRRRGLYHWQSPVAVASVISQVNNWKRGVGTLTVGDFFMLDAEQTGITEPETYDILCRAEDWTQRPSALYGGISTAGGVNWRSDRIRNSAFGPRFMWLAAYMPQDRLAAKLDQLGISHLVAHANQYSSNGPVPGVTGRCDMNQINDFELLDICCGYAAHTQPTTGDDMQIYYKVAGADARFVGTPLSVRWSGGDDKTLAAVNAQIAAGNLTEAGGDLTGGPNAFAFTRLEGPLPFDDTQYTWTGDEFANTAEIKGRTTSTVDQAARTAAMTAAASAANAQAAVDALRAALHNV